MLRQWTRPKLQHSCSSWHNLSQNLHKYGHMINWLRCEKNRHSWSRCMQMTHNIRRLSAALSRYMLPSSLENRPTHSAQCREWRHRVGRSTIHRWHWTEWLLNEPEIAPAEFNIAVFRHNWKCVLPFCSFTLFVAVAGASVNGSSDERAALWTACHTYRRWNWALLFVKPSTEDVRRLKSVINISLTRNRFNYFSKGQYRLHRFGWNRQI